MVDCTQKLSRAYFECAVLDDQDKNWDPNLRYLDFSNRLNKWFASKNPTFHSLYKCCGENKKIMLQIAIFVS